MIKGEKARFDIHKILYSIYKFNYSLNTIQIKKIINEHKQNDVSLINNVLLNSMRLNFHASKIIKKYIKKKIRDHERILLTSAITQIVYLGFKEYAVINCSVEIAKKLKIYPGLINATLKKISLDKKNLKNVDIKYDDLPDWFIERTSFLKFKEKKDFLENFCTEPNLHIVFKNSQKLKDFEESLVKTSSISGFLKNKINITNIKSFKNGDWWVQDFSSFFPLSNLKTKNNKINILDACAAPGGKSFQLLSNNFKVDLNDKSKKRISSLISNLDRLKFRAKITNEDFTIFKEDQKYDIIILDSPCSSVGTIRKNPEIFFKKNGPDFEKLNIVQEKILEKAVSLLNKDGLILYMVCSFLKNETKDQINKFLKKNPNFEICKFELINNNINYSKLIKENFMITLPNSILNNNIDGYFAAYLKKIDDFDN